MITNEHARQIAATWQSPVWDGVGMAQFASTGTVTDSLLDDIERTARQLETRDPALAIYVTEDGRGGWVDGDLGTVESNLADMLSLRDHVMALTVPVWTVGSNHAGYLPEGDVHAFLSYADAVGCFADDLMEAPESLCGDECTCDEVDADACDLCSLDALVKSYVRDEVPSVVNGKVFGEERPLSLALRPDSLPIPTVFWVARSERLVSDYLAERD